MAHPSIKNTDTGQPNQAFTLVELIVVIGIIALLSAILLPTLAVARNKARDIHCKNNLRQLGIVVRLYADENNERYPRIVETWKPETPSSPARNQKLRNLLEPQINEAQLFFCKNDTSDAFTRGGASYQWNSRMNGKLIDSDSRHQSENRPLLFDFAPRHYKSQNAVFEDGRVDRYEP